MKQGTYLTVTFVVFLVISVLHLLRLLGSWPAEIAGVSIPLWLSGLAVLAAGYLAYSAYRLRSNK